VQYIQYAGAKVWGAIEQGVDVILGRIVGMISHAVVSI